MSGQGLPVGDDFMSRHKEEFFLLANQTVLLANLAGSRLSAYASETLPHFSNLTLQMQVEVLRRLRFFNDVCQQVLADGKSLKDSATFIWYALRSLNFIFPSNLFQFIRNGHVIEVYDLNNIQIFRNFKFFDLTSYTLEDLLCRSWTDLFIRVNEEHTCSIIETCEKFYTKELTTVTPLAHVGMHRILESDSPFMHKMDAVIEYVAPIFDTFRRPSGFIAIESAELVEESPQGLKAEALLRAYYERKGILMQDTFSEV